MISTWTSTEAMLQALMTSEKPSERACGHDTPAYARLVTPNQRRGDGLIVERR